MSQVEDQSILNMVSFDKGTDKQDMPFNLKSFSMSTRSHTIFAVQN